MEKTARKESLSTNSCETQICTSAVPLSYLDTGRKDFPPHADLGCGSRKFTTSSTCKNWDKKNKG